MRSKESWWLSIRLALPAGLAVFAMFFGAGNIIFPMEIGAHFGGEQLVSVASGFLFSAIGLPLLGLFVTLLYRGEVEQVFKPLGFLGFWLQFVLICTLAVLVGNPRSSVIAIDTIVPYLPVFPHAEACYLFLFYFIAGCLCWKESKVMDIVGRLLSPVKIALVLLLIVVGMFFVPAEPFVFHHSAVFLFHGVALGYQTMDFLVTFFFATLVVHYVQRRAKYFHVSDVACYRAGYLAIFIGLLLLFLIYVGFMMVAHRHADALQFIHSDLIIHALASKVFIGFASRLFCLCIALACFITSVSLVAISSEFFYITVSRERFPIQMWVFLSCAVSYLMSLMGFSALIRFAMPVLGTLYPLLLFYVVVLLVFYRHFQRKYF